jgi:hypothetical protein
MTESAPQAIFDPERQAALARELARLDARPALDRTDLVARAARVLPPPPAVARILEATDAGDDPEPTGDPDDPADPDGPTA